MNKIKRSILVCVCLSLIACGASEDNGNNLGASGSGNTDSGGTYKSNYCVGDNVVDASDDILVMIDAFGLAPEAPPSIEDSIDNMAEHPEGLANGLLFSQFSMSAMSVNLLMVGPAIDAATNKDLVFPYWQGSYTVPANSEGDSSGETTITWRRSESTEYFNSTLSSGEYLAVSENSDCSGTLSSKTIEKRKGSIITTDGSWKISGVTTTGEVTRCIDGECYGFSW